MNIENKEFALNIICHLKEKLLSDKQGNLNVKESDKMSMVAAYFTFILKTTLII